MTYSVQSARALARLSVVGLTPPEWAISGTDLSIKQHGKQTFALYRKGKGQAVARQTGAPLTFRSLSGAASAGIEHAEHGRAF